MRKGKNISKLAVATAAIACANRAMAQFTGFQSPNDLVVVEVTNNGIAGNEDAVSLQEFTTSGTAVGNPLNLPTANGSALTLPDISDHDGQLELSANKKFLELGAYLANVGSPAANGETPEEAPRVISDISASGAINSTTQLSGQDDYNSVSMRSVTSVDGLEFWTTGNDGKPYNDPPNGDVGGLRYSTLGATTSTGMNDGNGFDNRTATIYNDTLYVDTGSDNSPGGAHTLYQVGSGGYPLPTNGPSFSALPLSGGGDIPGNQSPQFVTLANGTEVLYETNSTQGAVDKLVYTTSGWVYEGDALLSGVEDLTVSVSGNTVNLYSSTDGGVYDLTDSGGNGPLSSTTFNSLITPGANAQFRGISFAPLSTINSDWGLTTGGTWSTYVDWDNGVPWSPGDTATFGGALSSSGSVTLDGNWTIGHVIFNNSSASYTVATGSPTGTLTLNDAGGTGTADITVVAGSHTISAPVSLTSGGTLNTSTNTSLTISGAISGSGGLIAAGSGTEFLSGGSSYSGGTTVNAGATLVASVTGALPGDSALTNNGAAHINGNQVLSSLSGSGTIYVGSGVANTVQLATGSGKATQGGVVLSGNSTLDITNNHLIISYSGSDPLGTIYGYLKSGFNNGSWTGPGIVSSTAATQDATPGALKYGVGFADGNDGTHNVAGLSSGQIELKYTLVGDANLDGSVNGSDFSILAANFGLGATNWDQGNFLFSSSVNGSDFSALAANFGQGDNGADAVLPADLAALDAFAAANGLPQPVIAAVPEPGSIALLCAATAGLLVRRKRNLRTSNVKASAVVRPDEVFGKSL
jgi:autotransporter-associated beta strand protein